jgi:glycosyltransferase involved in cell wall biosynthesis
VQFLGYQNQEQIAAHLRDSHLFVMSSFAEGVPVVLMEAMAAGVPVIATHIAGIPELIDDGRTGFLTPPGDAETLAERIVQVLEDGELRARLAGAGREKVELDFNSEREGAWLLEIMKNALSGKPSSLRPNL